MVVGDVHSARRVSLVLLVFVRLQTAHYLAELGTLLLLGFALPCLTFLHHAKDVFVLDCHFSFFDFLLKLRVDLELNVTGLSFDDLFGTLSHVSVIGILHVLCPMLVSVLGVIVAASAV